MTRIIAGYGATAKLLHWLIVGLLTLQYVVAWSMESEDEASSGANPVHDLHVSLGFTILVLAVLRLLWRQTHPVLGYPELPKWQHYSARVTHTILYALVVAMPVFGILALSGETAEFELYGVLAVQLPRVPEALVEFSEEAHEALGPVLLG
jgi:cytochrome b561